MFLSETRSERVLVSAGEAELGFGLWFDRKNAELISDLNGCIVIPSMHLLSVSMPSRGEGEPSRSLVK